MIETTETTVATPMITPRRVRKLRSWLVVSAPAAMRIVSMCKDRPPLTRASRTLSPHRGERDGVRGDALGLFPLLLLFFFLLFHLRPIVDVAQRFERAGDDLLARAQTADNLDRALAGKSGLDRDECRRAVLVEEDPFLVLSLSAAAPRFFANDQSLDRNGHHLGSRTGDDVGGGREAGPHVRRRILDRILHLEIHRRWREFRGVDSGRESAAGRAARLLCL